jgi:hypothetical protein
MIDLVQATTTESPKTRCVALEAKLSVSNFGQHFYHFWGLQGHRQYTT